MSQILLIYHESLAKGLEREEEKIIESMPDQDFYEFLEYEICKAFDHSDNDQTKGFWCD